MNMRANNRVMDAQLVIPREYKESITRAFATILKMMFGAREERSDLLMDKGITNDDKGGGPPVAIDNGERRLAAVLPTQECGCRCQTASSHGDGTTVADVPRRQPMSIFFQ